MLVVVARKPMRPKEDRDLGGLGDILSSFLPQGRIMSPRGLGMGGMRDMLAHHIFGEIVPPGMMRGIDQPNGATRVSITPQGISVKRIQRMHKEFMGERNTHNGCGALHENPMEALLELLYSKANEQDYEPKMLNYIEDEAKEALGDPTLKKLHDFIDEAETGKVTVRTHEGKTITVIVGNTTKDKEVVKKKKEIITKASSGIFDLIVHDDNIGKEAALSLVDDDMLSTNDIQKLGLVQTDLVGLIKSLRDMMGTFDEEKENRLKELHNTVLSEYEGGSVSCNDREDQSKIMSILTHLIGEGGEDGAKELVFNTSLPVSEGTVIHIEGKPIDTNKLIPMTKDEAVKRYTPSLANYIYDEKAGRVTPEAIRAFLDKIKDIGKDPAKKDMVEMLQERLVTALFDELTPDGDDLADGTIEDAE